MSKESAWGLGGASRSGERQLDFRYIFKVQLTGFAYPIWQRYKGRRGINDNSKTFWPRQLVRWNCQIIIEGKLWEICVLEERYFNSGGTGFMHLLEIQAENGSSDPNYHPRKTKSPKFTKSSWGSGSEEVCQLISIPREDFSLTYCDSQLPNGPHWPLPPAPVGSFPQCINFGPYDQ